MIMTNAERVVYEVAIELKELFNKLHREDGSFQDFLLDRNHPLKSEYVDYLIDRGDLREELREAAEWYLHLSIGDANDNPFQRSYIFEQGDNYYPNYQYGTPSTKEVVNEIRHLFEKDKPLGHIPTYDDYLYQLEQEGVVVSDDFKKGYYKAIELYL